MIYNNFLSKYIRNKVDPITDIFKIILVNDNYIPSIVEDDTYTNLSLQNVEIQGTGYDKGGISFYFTGPYEIATDNNIYYKGSTAIWNNVTFFGARYAVIYKSSDVYGEDILVSYFDFGSEKSVENGTFRLSWGDNYVLSILLNNEYSGRGAGSGACKCERDNTLSAESTNSLENKITTGAIGALGVRFSDEELPEYAKALEEDLDVMSKISSKDIADIFDGGIVDPVDPSPTPSPGEDDDEDDKGSTSSELSFSESNAVQNKTLTETFASLGVVVNDESIPDKAGAVDGYVDTLREVSNSEIDAVFGKKNSICITYIPVGFEEKSFMNIYSSLEKITLPTIDIEGCSFKGWYSSSKLSQPSFVGKRGDEVTIQRSLTLYGKVIKD